MRHRLSAAALVLAVCASAAAPPAHAGPPLLGAYVPGGVAPLEARLGRKLDIDNHFAKFFWTSLGDEAADIAAGRTPMLSWSAGTGSGGCVLLADVTAGQYDPPLRAQAATIRALGGTVWLRLFYEMTDSPAEACANPTRSGPIFIAAWQHVVSLFRAAGAANAKWAWAPGEPAYAKNIELNYWPGGSFVDVVGEDHYWKTAADWPAVWSVCAVAQSLGKP
ncbi:MAG: hypothetical protein ACRECN_10005, partial [Methylocella sp.]